MPNQREQCRTTFPGRATWLVVANGLLDGFRASSAEAGRLWGGMTAEGRGLLLFGAELMMLRLADRLGGQFVAPQTPNGWQQAAELCRLGLLARDNDTLLLTERGRRALALTVNVLDGGVGYISAKRWGNELK